MVAGLIDLRANFLNGTVRMTWRFPSNAPEAVHIYGIRQSGNEISFDPRFHITRELRDCGSGIAFDYSGVSDVDVKRVTFCVFLAERNFNSPDLRIAQMIPGCFVSVITGRATVLFDVKSKPCGPDLANHRLVVKSSSTFDAGILGYMHYFNGKGIAAELPGRIDRGIRIYPPIYLQRAAQPPVICLIGGTNGDINIERGKIAALRYLFSANN